MQAGDEFKKIDGSKVFTPSDVSIGIQLSKGDNVNLLVDRDGKTRHYLIPLSIVEDNGSQDINRILVF